MLECYNDRVMQREIESIVEDYDFSGLADCSVLVTGATGLLGSHMVRTLACANRMKKANIRIYLQVRHQDKAMAIYGEEFLSREDINLVIGDIKDKLNINDKIDYIIHAASPTSSRYFVNNPVETIMDAITGTRNMLELARNAKGMVYLSSLEVYGKCDEELVNETSYGYIDYLNVRSSYSEGKRMCENLCSAFCHEYGVPVKIARLSQTFGTGVEYEDNRVFAQFIRSVIEKKDIVLHTQGNTYRSYLYTGDAVTGLLTVLLKGSNGEAYNLSNPETAISIRDMAQLVSDTFPDSGTKVIFDIPEDVSGFGYNPEMRIVLDISKARELGWNPKIGLKEMFINMKGSILERSSVNDTSV